MFKPFAYWAQAPLGRIYAEMPGGMGLEWHPLYTASTLEEAFYAGYFSVETYKDKDVTEEWRKYNV